MKLSEYTIKKTLGTKDTLKSFNGSYSSQENSAEVILTFIADGGEIDTDLANKRAIIEAEKLLNVKEDADWIKESPKLSGVPETH